MRVVVSISAIEECGIRGEVAHVNECENLRT